jgi:tetratricopeptide (TPR) repeat protein
MEFKFFLLRLFLIVLPGTNLFAESEIAVMDRLQEEGKQAYYRSDYSAAIEEWQQGLDMAQKFGNKKYISRFIGNIGIVFRNLGEYDKALSHYQQALAIKREIGDRRGESNNLTNMGIVFSNLGQYDKALSHCQQAIAIKREIGDRRGEGKNLDSMGTVFRSLGQNYKALSHYQQALAIQREIGYRRGEGGTLTNMGVVYLDLAQSDKALAHFRQSLAIDRKTGDRQGEGVNLTNMGMVFKNLGQYNKALSNYQQALAIQREIGDRPGEGKNLRNLGVVFRNLNQYDKAMSHFQQSLEIQLEIGDRQGQGADLNNMGLVYRNLGQYDQSLSHHQRALAIQRKIGDRRGEGGNLTNMGVVYRNIGQYDKAMFHFRKSLAIKREIGDRRGESADLNNLGLVFGNLGQYEKALVHFRQSLAIDRETGDQRGEGFNLNNMGVVYMNLGQYDKALSHFRQSLAIRWEIADRPGGGELNNMALVYKNLGEYDKALSHLQQAMMLNREMGERRREGDNHTNMGILYNDLGQYDKAEQSFSEGLKICEEVGAPESLWVAQRGLARVEVKLKRSDNAVAYYEQALNTIETMREGISEKEAKTDFMRRKIHVYDELIALLQSLHEKHPTNGYDQKSIEIFERKQGRIFLEEMGQSGARNFAGIPESILNQEAEFNTKSALLRKRRADEGSKPEENRSMDLIRELEARIEAAQAEQERLQKTIQSDHPDYYALKYPQPISLIELQQTTLQPGEALFMYNVMKESTALWVVTKEHFSLHTIDISQENLGEKITQYRNLAIAPPGRDLRGRPVFVQKKEPKNIPDLYDLLLPKSVRPVLLSAQILYFVPTGPLYLLPFETLKTEGGQHLIERYSVAYLSSASLLKIIRNAQARKRVAPRHPLLAFADPVYGESNPDGNALHGMRTLSYRDIMDGQFAPLPETENEVRAIQAILNAPEESRPLWLEADASRSNVFALNQTQALDDYRYLVFACHGILPGEIDQVTQPALVLSDPDPQTQENGYLTMADVFGLSLNADLVALSACNTGRGQSVQGEGVMGLTRAFMYAGTPATAVTLWSVESMSAKTLNVGFFKNLKDGKGRAQALREIKLDMLRGKHGEEWKKPYYWAPLVLFGDGN